MIATAGGRIRVVVIGGGTGSYKVLRGLKSYPLELAAIVSMLDDGGSSGRLRNEFEHLPPGGGTAACSRWPPTTTLAGRCAACSIFG